MSISLLDIGYAAGFYDGEGSVSSGKGKMNVCMSITQKDPEPLVKLQKLFGGEINIYNGYNYWRLHGVECRAFLLTIFSLLSDRRKKQILKYKEFFTTPDMCPNKHPYVDGSYRMIDDPRGRSYRSCLICNPILTPRDSPMKRAAAMYAHVTGISVEEALVFLQSAKTNEETNKDEEETIQ